MNQLDYRIRFMLLVLVLVVLVVLPALGCSMDLFGITDPTKQIITP